MCGLLGRAFSQAVTQWPFAGHEVVGMTSTAIVVVSALVLVVALANAVRRDRERMRYGRDAVWARREGGHGL